MLDVDQRDATQAPGEAAVAARDVAVPQPLVVRPDEGLDRTIAIERLGGEALAWAGTLLTATIIRLTSLGSDALTADGARHAYAAYALFRGGGTTLDSAAGGPFAVLVSAFLLFLFGISDQVVRLGPALAGIGLVALMIPLRPYFGRAGALLAGLLLAISPGVVYFSRQEQPDIYAAFFATLLFVVLLRACDHGRRGDFLLAACAAALLVVAAPVGPTLLLIVLIGGGVVALRGQAGDDDAARPFGGAVLRAAAREGALPALLLVVAIFLLIFSAFGAVPGNLATGPLEWLGAWGGTFSGPGGAEPGRDGGFALGLLPLYEPLALLAGFWAIGRLVASRGVAEERRGAVAARTILAGWAIVGVVLLAIGGATQPGLILLTVVPLTLLAGATLGELVERVDWRREGSFWTGGWGLVLCAALALAAWGVTAGQLLRPTRVPDETARALELLATIVVFALPLSGAALWFARRIDRRAALLALACGATVFLLAYGLRTAVGLSIYRADSANEPLVYRASTPEVRPLMERVSRLSRDLTALTRSVADPTGGHGLSIAVDPAVEWPVRWYLRDFPDLQIISTAALAAGTVATPNPPQLVFRPADSAPPPPGDYRTRQYRLAWSYPAGQPLTGQEHPILRALGFLVFRNNVAPAASADMLVDYGPELAQRLFLPPAPQGPFDLTARPGQGKSPGQFDTPRGVAIASDGGIAVVDMHNTRVQQYAADGRFVRQFGAIGRNDGQFWREASRGPTGIAIGRDGFIYVADTWNYRIQKFTPDGQFVAKWGTYVNLVTPPASTDRTGFYGPRGIAIGPNGDLYVTDTGNARVVVYGPDGTFRREFGTKGAGPAQLDEPVGIAISKDGSRIFVGDSNNARIAVFDGAGTAVAQWVVAEWRGKSFYEPYLALDADGALYATSSITRQVLKFNGDGQIVARGMAGVATEDTLGTPFGIAIAPDGSIYVSDGSKNSVVKLAPLR